MIVSCLCTGDDFIPPGPRFSLFVKYSVIQLNFRDEFEKDPMRNDNVVLSRKFSAFLF